MTISDMISNLVCEYNDYSELVALNYAQIREHKCDDSTLQWNRGSLFIIKNHLTMLVKSIPNAKLEYECKEHTFGFDDWKRQLVYLTVRVVIG